MLWEERSSCVPRAAIVWKVHLSPSPCPPLRDQEGIAPLDRSNCSIGAAGSPAETYTRLPSLYPVLHHPLLSHCSLWGHSYWCCHWCCIFLVRGVCPSSEGGWFSILCAWPTPYPVTSCSNLFGPSTSGDMLIGAVIAPAYMERLQH